jgi:hypothetical protein
MSVSITHASLGRLTQFLPRHVRADFPISDRFSNRYAMLASGGEKSWDRRKSAVDDTVYRAVTILIGVLHADYREYHVTAKRRLDVKRDVTR